MQKYGLQLRIKPQQQKKPAARPPVPAALQFGDADDDGIEAEISRQAARKRSLKDVEEQHRKALEEDPTAFSYDEVYDDMKMERFRPRAQDLEEKKPKYIEALIKKTAERKMEHEIIYERKLIKERNKEDHLFRDKEKFVTGAYKKQLEERKQWLERERLHELIDEKEDVTKKGNMNDFAYNIGKNVAFGLRGIDMRKHDKQSDLRRPGTRDDEVSAHTSDRGRLTESKMASETSRVREGHDHATSLPSSKTESYRQREDHRRGTSPPLRRSSVSESPLQREDHRRETSPPPKGSSVSESSRERKSYERETSKKSPGSSDLKPASDEPVSAVSVQEKISAEQHPADQPKRDHHKRTQDALAAARERFLARKKAKEQE